MNDPIHTLSHLADVVRLAAFASEARRVLSEVKALDNPGPLLEHITQGERWDDMPDTTAEVLDSVAQQMQRVIDALSDSEVGRHELQP